MKQRQRDDRQGAGKSRRERRSGVDRRIGDGLYKGPERRRSERRRIERAPDRPIKR